MSIATNFTYLIQSALNNFINKSKGFESLTNELILQTNICSSKDNLLNNINKRNNIINDINRINDTNKNLISYINILENIYSISKSIISTLSLNPTPSQFTTVGIIIKFNDIFNKTKLILEQIFKLIDALKILLNYINNSLNTILKLVELLDLNLNNCLNNFQIPSKELFININTIELILPTPVISEYKGYTFEIKTDENNYTPFNKRYAVAINRYGVIILKSESSFASDPNVLINELKFQIDQQNL
jgi:hypothetical protein